MKKGITFTAIVLGIFTILYIAFRIDDPYAAQEYTRTILYLPVWIIGGSAALILIGSVVFGSVWLVLKVDNHKVNRTFIRSDDHGRLPVPSWMVEDGRLPTLALQEYHRTAQLQAIHQPGQASHFVPARQVETLPGADLQPDTLHAMPSFADLLSQGKIGKGNPITLGFDETGKAIETDWKGLYSSAIGGRQGSGKSWSAANLIAQSVLHGSKLVVCDIHAGDTESITNRIAPLSSAYLFDVADNAKSVIKAIQNVDAILIDRSSGKDKSRDIILLVFDEFTSTLRRLGDASEGVSSILANIASEGRKFGIFALLIGHNWNAESTGGTEVRDNLTSALVHNLRPNEARMMTGLTASSLPKDTHALQPGQYYLLPKSGEMVKVQSPYMTDSDMVKVAGLLGNGSDSMLDTSRFTRRHTAEVITMPEDMPTIGLKYANDDQAYTATQSAKTIVVPTAESVEVKRLFITEGLGISEIVERVKGVKSTEGKKYQMARSEIESLLRSGI